MFLKQCLACSQHVFSTENQCPHCLAEPGEPGENGIRASLGGLLLGLSAATTPLGCVQDLYGMAVTDDFPSDVDDDGDGYTEREGDCHDEDPEIHPDAEETPGDDIDSNCDGDDDT
jgi:hypothetical protein